MLKMMKSVVNDVLDNVIDNIEIPLEFEIFYTEWFLKKMNTIKPRKLIEIWAQLQPNSIFENGVSHWFCYSYVSY